MRMKKTYYKEVNDFKCNLQIKIYKYLMSS